MTSVPDFDSAAEELQPGRHAKHPRLREAAAHVERGSIAPAAKLLKEFLDRHPQDANALHMLGEIALMQGRESEAHTLLQRSDLAAARYSLANLLLRMNRPEAALTEAETLLVHDPQNPRFRVLMAMALEAVEDYAKSAEVWRALTQDYPAQINCWTRYGHALRLTGRRDEGIAAYRKVIAIDPSNGGAWWSLADLKTYRFDDADVAQMEAQLAGPGLAADDRTQLHFALGKAHADRKLHETSFGHYAKGNALHRLSIKHDPEVLSAYVARCRRVFTAEFFERRAGFGCAEPGPVFVVGMMRSGSTLVEQILASHSQIEGTRELSDLAAISRELQASGNYPDMLATLDADTARRLGERYLEATRAHRRLGRPFFVDKMGANFAHVGLIALILPNAKIVDVRRHPLACGFSIFSQLFPQGQNDSYRLSDIAHLYRNYVALMAHFDCVAAGRVHRVFYESLVAEPEAEIRALFAYLGLPFEPQTLRFHESERVVTTVSSEQVRSPLYKGALERWRDFEPWLGPLAAGLGSVLDAYPSVPEEWC
jgi:tetratricopeptide (TPR) repeat protein